MTPPETVTPLPVMSPADAVMQCADVTLDPDHAAAVWRHASYTNDVVLWWLSFSAPVVDPDEPPTFLGTVVTPARNVTEAIASTHRNGINPGGMITVSGPFPLDAIDDASQNVLLTREDIDTVPVDRVSAAVDRYVPKAPAGSRVCYCGFIPAFWPCSSCGRDKP